MKTHWLAASEVDCRLQVFPIDGERKENWAKYQCKSCDQELYFISSSSVWSVGDFFSIIIIIIIIIIIVQY